MEVILMMPEDEITEEELNPIEVQEAVQRISNPDDLALILVEQKYPLVARNDAAEKLIRMWEEGNHGVPLEHLFYVVDYADEPHKSKANQIIRDNI